MKSTVKTSRPKKDASAPATTEATVAAIPADVASDQAPAQAPAPQPDATAVAKPRRKTAARPVEAKPSSAQSADKKVSAKAMPKVGANVSAAPKAKKAEAAPAAAKGPSERVKPLNFRVSAEFRKAFKQAAAAQDCKKVELLERMFALWQGTRK